MNEDDAKLPVISVIMPVYNAGDYLREAIESVLEQTFVDFELILIDDGATDGSGEVCDEYAAKDARVIVRHGRNGGICASRNVGLALARGTWLTFCDHDDFCEKDWLEALLRVGEQEGVPVVKCAHREYVRTIRGTITERPIRHLFRDDCTATLGDLRCGESGYRLFLALSSALWNGLYRRECWEGLRFDTNYRSGGEDCAISIDLLLRADRVCWLNRKLYRHYTNEGISTSATYHPSLLEQYLAIGLREQAVLGFTGFEARYAAYRRWGFGVYRNVLSLRGCPLSFREKAVWLQTYFDRLVGRDLRPVIPSVSPVRRIGTWLLRHGLSRTYYLLLAMQRLLEVR